MASVTCAKCGQVWIRAEDVGFCAKCGAALEVSTVQINEQPVAAQPKVTPKKKVTFQVWPVIALVSALVLGTVIFSLADEDFNLGVKETFGVDIAGTLENVPGAVTTSANVFKFSSDCASQLCDVTITNARGNEESFKSIAPRTWGFPGIGSQDYFISVWDSEGKSATCTIYGDGKLIESDSSVSSDATCQVNR